MPSEPPKTTYEELEGELRQRIYELEHKVRFAREKLAGSAEDPRAVADWEGALAEVQGRLRTRRRDLAVLLSEREEGHGAGPPELPGWWEDYP